MKTGHNSKMKQRLGKTKNHKHKQINRKTEKAQIIKSEVFYDFTTDSHENDKITSKYLHILKNNREV